MSAASRRSVLDGALAAAVVAAGLAELLVPFASVQGSGSRAVTSAAVVVVGGVLCLRRVAPLATAAVALLAWPALFSLTPLYVLFWGQFVPMAIALFSVARHGRGRAPYAGAALGAAALLFFDLRVDALQGASEIVFHWAVFALTWSAGRALAVHERRSLLHLQRAVDAEVSAASAVLQAIVDERTRIARELHDVVAHAVSSIVVQAGAAEQVVESDPAYVRARLETIRTSGSEALEEMRRVVAILRQEGDAGALAPQPGVGLIPGLLAEARAQGLDVEWVTEGEVVPLSPGLDLAVYRIVQEALTNVRRHAHATRVLVRLAYDARGVRVDVSDDGCGSSASTGPRGHGLVGMTERAALYGGTVRSGPAADRGFVVIAELPLTGAR
ncbi:sensor histidine kinase [Nocardioides marmoribigeumensis]|uniref:histidine kinase n=1 Tax=Nocardioides marmoribigeumensis TaxID=433649 RepID=A0ABU2C0R8_9ACTN|nr:sensor histidine kinase [Nocardioides marmoribigeumensis]MDR7364219.1 signal transduction histidine kinase [Nocardioides marmoribigeumensis]